MTVSEFCHFINDTLLHPDKEENTPTGYPREVWWKQHNSGSTSWDFQ